jgi:hypothetical protein
VADKKIDLPALVEQLEAERIAKCRKFGLPDKLFGVDVVVDETLVVTDVGGLVMIDFDEPIPEDLLRRFLGQ